jgi:hypothetical protein
VVSRLVLRSCVLGFNDTSFMSLELCLDGCVLHSECSEAVCLGLLGGHDDFG